MVPLSRFGLHRGWDTIIEICAIVISIWLSAMYIGHTIRNGFRDANVILSHDEIILDKHAQSVKADSALSQTRELLIQSRLDLLDEHIKTQEQSLATQQKLISEILRERESKRK